jgi:hypothetical protein
MQVQLHVHFPLQVALELWQRRQHLTTAMKACAEGTPTIPKASAAAALVIVPRKLRRPILFDIFSIMLLSTVLSFSAF